ncbi:MAG: flippase-like domain-containing protein [Bacteroidia bacterium]|nr:flippase-like domain-containing protein [Bacteroidia bacterium]NNM23724.1 hypothetical protein [Flavobacteriaceae bacterium]
MIALKVLILCVTFVYIYWKLNFDSKISMSQFFQSLQDREPAYLLLFTGMAAINWSFEIVKWKLVISRIRQLSFLAAARQSLMALTVSLATPNRIGDYGAKAYFYDKSLRKQVLLLNLFSNLVQMLITVLFGIFGIAYVVINFGIELSISHTIILITILVVMALTGYFFKEKELFIKGLSIAAVWNYFKSLTSSVVWKVSLFSLFKYLVFSTLFLLMLHFFQRGISIFEVYPLIFAMYLMVSVVPTLFILDVVVRGGVAVYLFSLVGIGEWPILATVTGMWLLNFVLPALWGGYYLITYKK